MIEPEEDHEYGKRSKRVQGYKRIVISTNATKRGGDVYLAFVYNISHQLITRTRFVTSKHTFRLCFDTVKTDHPPSPVIEDVLTSCKIPGSTESARF
jgi:hypothetical protein